MKRDYFVQAAKGCGQSVKEYYDDSEYNYVIIEGLTPICWTDDDTPQVYSSAEDALYELSNWRVPLRNVSIVTERELIDSFCLTEMQAALAEVEEVMDDTNSHDSRLVARINDLWAEDKGKFRPILRALYQRDLNEIADSDAFGWNGESLATKKRQLDDAWSYFATPYLKRVADDQDLVTIINFINGTKQ